MFNPNNDNFLLQKLRYPHGLRVVAFCILTAGAFFGSIMPAHGEVDLADAPMFTKINPPPTNIMILLDDSGSMTFEILVKGAYDGQFPNPDRPVTEGFCYVFDDMGDKVNISGSWRQMDDEGRKYWRSQWHAINVMYYNPSIIYEPWPGYEGKTFLPADPDKPLVHPLKTKTLDLDKKAFSIGDLKIKWAHYFVKSTTGTVYLVVIDGDAKENRYYTFSTDGGAEPNDKIETATSVLDPPADIAREYDIDRQNFANWFTYYRRREFVAKAAIARVLRNMDGVRVGILGINDKIIAPLKPVKAVIGGEFKDETDALIQTLYGYTSGGGTPLKEGLQNVGEYYRVNDGNLEGQKGDLPYPTDGGACQQSFTIVVTDGYYSDTDHTSVGNADGDKDNETWGGQKQPYSDDYKDTLADIAMHYYATDLSPDEEDVPKGDGFEDLVPTNKWDRAPHQHMVTFAVAFGVSGTLNPADYEEDRTNENYMKFITKKDEPREYGDYVVWPNVPGDRKPESIDDLWHATVNGRGVFVNAGEPQALVEGMLQIIRDIKEREPTSAASVSVNGDGLFGKIGPDVLIFQASYSYQDNEWGGDVKAYRVDEVTGDVLTAPEDLKWSAAQVLQSKAWSTRNILTFDGDNSGLFFEYEDLTDAQKQKLGSDLSAGSAADLQAENIANFIRGKDFEGTDNREPMLGDVVHSSPVFEDDAVYVGANDGMLHAFDVNSGTELFAYVPNLVFDHLKDIADPSYAHQFYVDLTPTVKAGEGLLGGVVRRTMLVGGLGKGGKGYFALDITNPHAINPTHVLWEFPKKDTLGVDVDDMGYSFSKPIVVPSYSAAYPWIVIFGNGYNSPNGNSALFIINPLNGDVIKKIEAGIGPDNGLSSPIAVDVDFDGIVDFVYAGDLKGNLWKFDLTSDIVANWDVAFKDSGGKAAALFAATDPAGNPQPITSKPDVMFHPEKPGFVVSFGTGKFLGVSDFANTQIQTIYGIWDYGDRIFQPVVGWSPDDNKEFLGEFLSRDEAAQQLFNQPEKVKLLRQEAADVEVDFGDGNIAILRALTANQPEWKTVSDPDGGGQLPNPSHTSTNHVGWYLDLDVYPGERVVSDVILRNGIMIVIGFIPDQGRCGSGGESVFMELNAFSGGQLAGINFDVNDDATVDEKDMVEIEVDGIKIKVPPSGKKLAGNIQPPAILRLNEKTEKKYLSSSSGGIVEIAERAAKTGIAYWMEIRQ
jgi:type IV pilus assembly protein PilY1